MFLRNYWYAVAWDGLYRHINGGSSAFEDCCPHRLLPLSMGFLKDDHLVCKYHGLEFDQCGKCVWMPGQHGIHSGTDVRKYPVAEKHRFVWVWIGDPSLADEKDIPDLPRCPDPKWVFDGETYHSKCNCQLLLDNLMDLSYETFVHPSSIGQQEILEALIKSSSDENSATVTRWMHDIMPPPFWASNLRSTEKCDRWQICHFALPSNVTIGVGVAPVGTGAPRGDRSQRGLPASW